MFRMIKLTSSIHDNPENNRVLINPWDISAICPHKDQGSIVTIKVGFTYKVRETVEEIEDMARTTMAPIPYAQEEKPWNG